MKLAVIGSRVGADLGHVSDFLHELWLTAGETVLVSGGAEGVDTRAELDWRGYGGQVISFRVKQHPSVGFDDVYGIQRLELNDETPKAFDLIHEPTFADYTSALKYRDMLIAEECDRLVAFVRKGGSRGAGFTAEIAETAERKPVYRFEAA